MSQIIERKEEKKLTVAEVGKKISAMREKDNELVSGIFRFLEHPKGILRFKFKKYAGDEYKAYELVDGMAYRLPRMVVKHLNNNCHYLDYKHLPGENGAFGIRTASDRTDSGRSVAGGIQSRFGSGEMRTSYNDLTVATKVHRCEFRPLEFMDQDLDLFPSNLVEVTKNL